MRNILASVAFRRAAINFYFSVAFEHSLKVPLPPLKERSSVRIAFGSSLTARHQEGFVSPAGVSPSEAPPASESSSQEPAAVRKPSLWGRAKRFFTRSADVSLFSQKRSAGDNPQSLFFNPDKELTAFQKLTPEEQADLGNRYPILLQASAPPDSKPAKPVVGKTAETKPRPYPPGFQFAEWTPEQLADRHKMKLPNKDFPSEKTYKALHGFDLSNPPATTSLQPSQSIPPVPSEASVRNDDRNSTPTPKFNSLGNGIYEVVDSNLKTITPVKPTQVGASETTYPTEAFIDPNAPSKNNPSRSDAAPISPTSTYSQEDMIPAPKNLDPVVRAKPAAPIEESASISPHHFKVVIKSVLPDLEPNTPLDNLILFERSIREDRLLGKVLDVRIEENGKKAIFKIGDVEYLIRETENQKLMLVRKEDQKRNSIVIEANPVDASKPKITTCNAQGTMMQTDLTKERFLPVDKKNWQDNLNALSQTLRSMLRAVYQQERHAIQTPVFVNLASANDDFFAKIVVQ